MVTEQPADDGLVELLFVQEAGAVRFADGKLTLTDLNPQTLYFADRLDDPARFLSYKEYVDLVLYRRYRRPALIRAGCYHHNR